MDFAAPLSDLVKYLWGLASTPLGYIYNLKDNVRSLDKANENLKALSEDVKARVEREGGGGGAQRTNQVENWLGEVQEFEDGACQVLQEAGERDRIKCLSHCLPRNCWSSYKLGKRVYQLLNEARELQHIKEEISDFTSPLPPPHQVLEMPLDKTVGLDSSLKIVWKWLVDKKEAGVIGLYGAGGVGKTTLMRRINEKLSHASHGFEVVIWVVVSKQVNEDSIRDTIRKKLNVKDESWEGQSQNERVRLVGEVLSRKKFVLLMDDVWVSLDLHKIGVLHPSLKNGSKVVFTTRSKQVCHHMSADETLEVKCLMPEEALALFENNIGKSSIHSHPEIQELANDIVKECKGLPLALITVGRAMAGRENPDEWKHALKTLRYNPYELSGMVNEVYHILEFSFNSLNDSIVELCFLYCCLFPEDYPIRTNDLIELWIGEGLLRGTNDVYSMRYKGEYVLRTLEMACLLESGGDYEGRYVKMHDVIRDMATWITRDHGQKENKLLVIENHEDMSAEMILKWREAKKVSLWGKWIRNIDQTPPMCSQLEILFVRETNVTVMPKGFFDSMTAHLTILDLSHNKHIKSFPKGICNLINLRYLNLSATCIDALPKKIKKLTCLRWLLLDNISKDILIPTRAIANLPLNVFSKWDGFMKGTNQVEEEEMVEKLERMQHLTDLSISVKIFQSPNLRRRIRRARISNMQNNLTTIVINYSPPSSGSFSHLELLYLIAREDGDHSRKRTSSQQLLLPQSRSSLGRELRAVGLVLARARSKTSEIDGIGHLPKLRSICNHTLFFPQGVSFGISNCPGLKKLPLDSNSMRGGFSIYADKHWWAEFEWDPAARVTFQKLSLDGMATSVEEQMTFGEAARKVKDESFPYGIRIEFLPHNEAAGEGVSE
ncbi:hypothetical protein BT93_L2137 [Corymbia citriodora subsp. variegata]|uniref:AAA+ ATPase domain-containing protein n=1 Tax=Corymbia citriodora subsp. variegata TaxID=360336 RepID=A0A8T0CKU2_CORYI|nr:hypothetical protein BT93_L2137 [Corymbia citriodora subsp. variegata]